MIEAGWLDPPKSRGCDHPERPRLGYGLSDEGRRWRCSCGRVFLASRVYDRLRWDDVPFTAQTQMARVIK